MTARFRLHPYIHTLLIMEDDLNVEPSSDVLSKECNSNATVEAVTTVRLSTEPDSSEGQHVVDWYVCGRCRPIPLEIETKCCRLKDCITTTALFKSGRVRAMHARICDKLAMREKTVAQDFSQGADSLTWPGMETWV